MTSTTTTTLFEPVQLGSLTLRNRVVMAPMTRSRALGGVPNRLMAEYYRQRATAGLIITEGTAPSPNALGYPRIPGLYAEAQVQGWREVTDAVHEEGGRMIAQLMHVGRIAHPHNLPEGARPLAPSAVRPDGNMYTDQEGPQPYPTPQAMTLEDVAEARGEFVHAARSAIAAGFDGVELHGANAYLLEQFLNPHTNRREDAYGGGVEARIRFVAEVAHAVADAIGAERTAIRLSPYNTFNDLPRYDQVEPTYVQLASQLRGLLYIHLVRNPAEAYPATEAAIRRAFGGPIILNGNFDRASAEAVIASGDAALVAFGRPFIANPDLVRRFERAEELGTPDPGTFYTPGAEGYTDYPVGS